MQEYLLKKKPRQSKYELPNRVYVDGYQLTQMKDATWIQLLDYDATDFYQILVL